MKPRKLQIGPRVDPDTYEALKRLAAATGCSIGNYCARVLEEHITRQTQGDDASVFDEVVQQIEQRIADQHKHQQRELDVAVKRLEKNFNAVKAMIDAHVETSAPETREAYLKAVERILRAMGIQAGPSNGARP